MKIKNCYLCALGDVQPPTPEKHCKIRGKQNHTETSHDGEEKKAENKGKVEIITRSCFGKRERKISRASAKHVFLSGCRRSNNTQHPRLKSLHAENISPISEHQDKKESKKKRIKIRKWQWKMYSPSGSKRGSIKKKLGG